MSIVIFQQRHLLTGFVVLLLLWTIDYGRAGSGSKIEELLSYEPLQYLRTVSRTDGGDSAWRDFVEMSAQEAGDITAEMKKRLKVHLAKSGTSVVLAKGERVLTQRRSTNLKWDSTIELPYSNTLSLFSVILPILLEGYKHDVIDDPIGDVLRGEDVKNPLVRGHEARSFLDLLNKLPRSGAELDLDSDELLKDLDANGALAVYFANAILGKSAREAWMDALMAIGIQEMKFSHNGLIVMNLKILLQYVLTVLHDFNLLGVVPKSEILPPDNDRYLFGWWQNCPKTKSGATMTRNCYSSYLPEDAIFSISRDVRIYISPSIELTMIVLGPDASPATASGQFSAKMNLKSIGDILRADSLIWEQLYSVISIESSDADTVSQSDASEQERENKKSEQKQKRDSVDEREQTASSSDRETVKEDLNQSELAEWIHWMWPMVLFVFWVTISHVWVYWLLHCVWLIMTRLSSRAHIPRPKTAAEAGQN